ncbi:hypothetical protein [Vulcanococcus limneticus]|uniref:hypothetical protein n=1 Tax=Vulcanococcus limneticus TaxID=2170428 RepID=UPI00398BF083
MKPSVLLISGAVVVVLAGILAAVTDLDVAVVRWVSCGPLGSSAAKQSEICR